VTGDKIMAKFAAFWYAATALFLFGYEITHDKFALYFGIGSLLAAIVATLAMFIEIGSKK